MSPCLSARLGLQESAIRAQTCTPRWSKRYTCTPRTCTPRVEYLTFIGSSPETCTPRVEYLTSVRAQSTVLSQTCTPRVSGSSPGVEYLSGLSARPILQESPVQKDL
ncbi:hypothetical protein DPMN_118948 [Dreissena polymorpha]|uniref:Uncharacterized protein n=1 Tax=Dreissena polymorpha TaxID=45954 RepID=A0A9D4JNZ4_DREPO|nr:hypothetical protein DPMN_118948 [Dreissena polymorpha]